MHGIVLFSALCMSCAGARPLPPTVVQERRVEERTLPPDPETEKLEGPQEEWVEPLESGTCPTRSGIAMSEAKAARLGLFKIRYVELRRLYEADRMIWKAHRELYEERLELADRTIQNLQPRWWDRHKGEVGVIGGFVLGVGVAFASLALAN